MIKALSLFSGIGVGEFYLSEIGIDTIVASELVEKRSAIHQSLFPTCQMVTGDLCKREIKSEIYNKIGHNQIDLIIITPPCQGFSTAGKNRKDDSIHGDVRNHLILEAFDFIDKLNPSFVLIENVQRFINLKIEVKGKIYTIETLLREKYQKEYNIEADISNALEFGVPQIRYRAIIRMWKKNRKWRAPYKLNKVITLNEAIGELPSLEPGESSSIKNHWARPHPENHIKWMRHTPTGQTAYDNLKYFPKNSNGVRIKGYNNCYRRIEWDKPAPTVTMRNEIISSQNNVHPGRKLPKGIYSDPRVLTLRELFIVSSMPPDLDMPSFVSDTAFRQLVGEGVPPQMIKNILQGINN